MSIYKVTLPSGARIIEFDGISTHIVEAISEAAALVAVKAVSSQDMNSAWDAATITEVLPDWAGVVFTIVADAGGTPESFEYVGEVGDTWTSIGTELEFLCEVPYTSSFAVANPHGKYGTLIVATGGGADDLGDKTLDCTAIGPNGEVLSTLFFAGIVSEGAANANLAVDLIKDCPTPRVLGSYK